LFTVRFRPLRMRLSSIWTTRFLISSIVEFHSRHPGRMKADPGPLLELNWFSRSRLALRLAGMTLVR
jgi:hypothetical protein